MKLKKILFLPLAMVALAGCEIGARPVDSKEANKQVAEAMQKATTEEYSSVEGSVKTKLEILMIDYVDSVDQPTAKREAVVDGALSLKIKDFKKDTMQMMGTLDAKFSMKEDNLEVFMMEGSGAVYFAQDWLYAGYKVSMKESADSPIKSQEDKIKVHTGALNFGNDLVPQEVDLTNLETMLNSVEKIHARMLGDDLHVTYEITQDDLINGTTDAMIEAMGELGKNLTSEQIEGIRKEAAKVINEAVKIRAAKVTVVVGKDGYISKVDAELDMDIFLANAFDEEGEPEVETKSKVTVRGSLNYEMRYNQPVTITLPDFTNYRELDMSEGQLP